MFITPLQKYKLKKNKAEVLDKVEKFEDVSFGHIVMAEKILAVLGLDSSTVMDAVVEKRKESKEAKRVDRYTALQRNWKKRLTDQINKGRSHKFENEVHVYYKTEPTFSETKEFKWEDYTALVSFWVADDVTLDDIYMLMQGDVWSPEGEARELIEMLGLKHTSMSIGDVIDMPDHALLEVATVGFKPVGRPKD